MRSVAALRLIGLFKLAKALLLILIAVGAGRLLHQDPAETVARWIADLHLDPDNRLIEPAMARIAGFDLRTLRRLEIGGLFYAGLMLTEGAGLMLGKRWAEYVTIIVTTSLIP